MVTPPHLFLVLGQGLLVDFCPVHLLLLVIEYHMFTLLHYRRRYPHHNHLTGMLYEEEGRLPTPHLSKMPE